jgi:hypothetical protein
VAIAADLSSFTLQTTGGQTMTFSTAGSTGILAGVQVGESVQVSYTQSTGGAFTAVEISPQSVATGPYRGGR